MKIEEAEPPDGATRQSEFERILYSSGIPLPHFIPKTKANHYFYKNGLSKLIPRLKLKVHTNLEECQKLWEMFSPNESLFDLWEVRKSWMEHSSQKVLFYTLYDSDRAVALLPIWYSTIRNQYEYFGGDWMQDNKIFMENSTLLALCAAIIPKPAYVGMMNMRELSNVYERDFVKSLVPDASKNVKSLIGMQSISDFLAGLTKKRRYNLRADVARIEAFEPEVKIIGGYDEECFENLIRLNQERFDGIIKKRSYFEDKNSNLETWLKRMVRKQGSYTTKFVSVCIGGETVAIDLIVEYSDTYYMLIGGNSVGRYSGIGNYILYKEFEDAIAGGKRYVDGFCEDFGWKHKYFDQIPTFKLQSP